MSTFFSLKSENLSYATRSSFLKQIKSGDEEAWMTFYSKYVGMIHSIGKRHNLSKEECDDLMVEVMLIFWKKLDNFIYDRSKGKFRSFLSRISDLAAIKIYKKNHSKNFTGEIRDLPYPAEVDEKYMQEYQDFILDKALDNLKESVDTETYEVFYMSVFQDRPVTEIALVTRKSPGSIYAIRHRCLKKLKNLINTYRQYEENNLAPQFKSEG